MVYKVTYWVIVNLLLFTGCKNYDYKIDDFEKEEVAFTKQPDCIKEIYLSPKKSMSHKDLKYNFCFLINLDSNKYTHESVKTLVGPWISHYRIEDVNRNIVYKISHPNPHPFIIFKDKLYIPTEYNSLVRKSKFEELTFNRYSLLGKRPL
ncbi:hypothetical protein EYV94_27555 [Puteibacter caeruleilacunae]|nr:hypothetical protein EYV94_27555 [Puteibacter caeruleilacunae]